MNEADTRAELIDPQLSDAGWITGVDVRVQREHNINAGRADDDILFDRRSG